MLKFILYIVLIIEVYLDSLIHDYLYENYSATSVNENLTGKNLQSLNSDESVVYITNKDIKIFNSNLIKRKGNSTNIKNSELYGVNAAVLVQGGEVEIAGGQILSQVDGSSALCSTNEGNTNIYGGTIIRTTSNYAKGLHSTYEGKITLNEASVITSGNSSPALLAEKQGNIDCIIVD